MDDGAKKERWPRCSCGGPFIAERENPLKDEVTSVKCVLCSHRIYRNFELRRPTRAELGLGGKGMARRVEGARI